MLIGTVWVIEDRVSPDGVSVTPVSRRVLEFAVLTPLEFKRYAASHLETTGEKQPSQRLEFGPIGTPWGRRLL